MSMGRNKHKKRKGAEGLELNMTAMCDVIFQLLIYLILTAKPPVVFANLDISRPQADPNAKNEKIQGMVEIMVGSDAWVVQGKRVESSTALNNIIKQLGELDKNQTVMIKCTWDSPHEKLILLLDLCSLYKLTNLSVMSM